MPLIQYNHKLEFKHSMSTIETWHFLTLTCNAVDTFVGTQKRFEFDS